MRNRVQVWVLGGAFALVSGVVGCDCGDGDGTADGGGGGTLDGAWTGDGPIVIRDGDVIVTEDGGITFVCHPTECNGHLLECGDCMDNDGDGLTDYRDPECLGPCDNTEGPALLAGVGGETGGPCKADCYFDFGNGSGNDDCFWDHQCDPLSVDPDFHPEGPDCPYDDTMLGSRDCPDMQSSTCLGFCRPLTPNGCDCFGCCTFDEIAGRPAAEGGSTVWIGSVVEGTNDGSCTFEDILDTTKCRPCTPVVDCFNDCGTCELCIGREELPAECYEMDGGTMYRCDPGVQVCGLAGDAPCPEGLYCITGCCVVAPI
jgi:hypothetical protein